VVGRNDSIGRLPGLWVRAAAVAQPDSLTARAYLDVAFRSGVTPLQGPRCPPNGPST
jgi:hypothetical protein